VKLRSRAEGPHWRRGRTISFAARSAKRTTRHGPLQRLSGCTARWLGSAILAVLVEQNQSCDRRKKQPKKEPQPSISSCRLRPVGTKESKQVENHSFRCVVHDLYPALFMWRVTMRRKKCSLTVKLSSRTTPPDRRRGRTLSPRACGDPAAHHGPLQRLLGVTLASVLRAEMSERLHTFRVRTSLSPTPAQGRAANRDPRAWLRTPRGSAIVRT
jgi:hypothetical protein